MDVEELFGGRLFQNCFLKHINLTLFSCFERCWCLFGVFVGRLGMGDIPRGRSSAISGHGFQWYFRGVGKMFTEVDIIFAGVYIVIIVIL